MGLINSLKSKLSSRRTKRVIFIGIDGVPCSLVETLVKEDAMPNLAEILDDGGYSEMTSVYPTISSVAWSTIVTGKNPGKHNIYGFIDVDRNSKSIRIPKATDRKARTIWDILSNEGRRSVIVNVPITYPPAKINGIMISGFLTPSVEEVVIPKSYLELLKKYSYRIDVNSKLGHQDKAKLMEDIHDVFDKRRRVIIHLLNEEKWDFFMAVIMETDRINHFFWDHKENGEFHGEFMGFYSNLDKFIGEINKKLHEDDEFIIASDHGFCEIKQEINIQRWFEKNNYTKYTTANPRDVVDINFQESDAYSLTPRRIYINNDGIRDDIKSGMLALKEETGEKVVETVYEKRELYNGPCLTGAPDLVVVPRKGYDLKSKINKDFATRTAITGMHTYDDAFICIKNCKLTKSKPNISDIAPTILELMNIEGMFQMDGSALIYR